MGMVTVTMYRIKRKVFLKTFLEGLVKRKLKS
jgi:hypothetical protein